MAKLDGLGYIFLLDKPLSEYNITDVLKRGKIIPFFDFHIVDKSVLLNGNYYFRNTVIFFNL